MELTRYLIAMIILVVFAIGWLLPRTQPTRTDQVFSWAGVAGAGMALAFLVFA